MKCQTVVIRGNGAVELENREIPQPVPNSVVVKIHATLISPGTEVQHIRDRRKNPVENDIVLGYSCAGEIVEICGDAHGLEIGQRVGCMTGGHVSYAVVPVNLVVPLPDNVSYEEGCFLSLAATALQGVRRTDVKFGEYGTVLGLGIVGNIAAQLFRLNGCRVLGLEGMDLRLDIAKRCGIQTVNINCGDSEKTVKEWAEPYGLDFSMIAFGGDARKAFDSVHRCMKVSADGHEMGRITLIGGCAIEFKGGAWSGNLDIRASSRTGAGYHDKAWELGADYPSVFVQFTSQRNARELAALIAEKRLLVQPLITNKMALAQADCAYDALLEHPDQNMGIILYPEF